MKRREFNKIINACCYKGKGRKILNLDKIRALPIEQRREMGLFLIRERQPLLVELAAGLDESWLYSMGYTTTTQSPTYPQLTFIHTREHTIR